MRQRTLARSIDTRNRILDAAETLFSERGLEGASMRAMTAAAGVNLAAVNYHFGAKEGLVVAVYARRLRPLNEERLRLLTQAEARTPLRLEEILSAYFAPVLRLLHDSERGQVFGRLLVRAMAEPGPYLAQLFLEEMAPVQERFTAALGRMLPGLPAGSLFWRMNLATSTLHGSVAGGGGLELPVQGSCDPSDVEALIQQLVEFTAGGMQAGGATSVKKGHHPERN